MDHRYIDENSLADRYLAHTLAPEESVAFEAHLVDCQECRDRLLLAEMFHVRNGVSTPGVAGGDPAEPPAQIRLSTRGAISQLILLFAGAAAAALAALAGLGAIFWWLTRH